MDAGARAEPRADAARLDWRLWLGFGEFDDMAYWRLTMLGWVRAFLLVAVPLTAWITFPHLMAEGHHALVIFDIVAFVGVLSMVALRRHFHVQAALFLSIFWVWTALFFTALGPGGARPAWLVVAAMVTAMLYGLRGGLAAIPAGVAVLLGTSWLAGEASPAWADARALSDGAWRTFVVNTMILQACAGLATGYLLDRLEQALARAKTARDEATRHTDQVQASLARVEAERAEKALLQSRLLQSEKLESLGQLASGIAHDLNNMLTPISMYAELIRDDVEGLEGQDGLRSDLDEILASTFRARDLTQQILAFGREIGRTDKLVNASRVTQQAVREVSQRAPKNVRVHCSTLEDDLKVRGNDTALHRVIMNLVTNGVHATEVHGGQVHVRVVDDAPAPAELESHEHGYLLIEVADEGIGIRPELLERIFDPFFTTKRMGKGTGLGLATVHGIVRALGGTITVESEVGVGTTFRVYLPLDDGDTESVKLAVVDFSLETRVLLVDDDRPSREAVARMLTGLGAEVTAVSSARLASARLEASTFGLLITDHDMPGLTGAELVGRIRRRGDLTPAVLISGVGNAEVRRRVLEAPRTAFLAKPFTRSELLAALGPLGSLDRVIPPPNGAEGSAMTPRSVG